MGGNRARSFRLEASLDEFSTCNTPNAGIMLMAGWDNAAASGSTRRALDGRDKEGGISPIRERKGEGHCVRDQYAQPPTPTLPLANQTQSTVGYTLGVNIRTAWYSH